MKIQLKSNVRYFEADDSDFMIQSKEIKELHLKHLRSYSIKYYLVHGLFEVVEGSMVFQIKGAFIYAAKDQIFIKEADGSYFTKHVATDTLESITEKDISSDILKKLNPGLEVKANVCLSTDEIETVIEDEQSVNTEVLNDFETMTKKELKAFAKKNNIKLTASGVHEIREELNTNY